jgi:tRNA nucleotidyltransferase (CCA-adding enzyme)
MKLKELLLLMQNAAKEANSSKPLLCGGIARDRYMGRLENISDLDVTTGDKTVSALSEKFAEILNRKYNLERKIMDDGHSTIFIGNIKIDFSSNFNVPGIDQILKNMGIEKATDLQKEMFSRDFTCNALLLDFNLRNIIDETKRGMADIKDKKIKTCLSPEITLTTNKNRIVRSIYLSSKLGFDIDESIINFIKRNPNILGKTTTKKSMIDKLNGAFKKDGERASYNLTKMELWRKVPITENMKPYYLKYVK